MQYSPIAIRRVENAGQPSNSHTAATPDNCGESEPPGARPPQSRTRKQPAAPDDAGVKQTNSPVLSPLVQRDIVDVRVHLCDCLAPLPLQVELLHFGSNLGKCTANTRNPAAR